MFPDSGVYFACVFMVAVYVVFYAWRCRKKGQVTVKDRYLDASAAGRSSNCAGVCSGVPDQSDHDLAQDVVGENADHEEQPANCKTMLAIASDHDSLHVARKCTAGDKVNQLQLTISSV
jgi:hypothetical protein